MEEFTYSENYIESEKNQDMRGIEELLEMILDSVENGDNFLGMCCVVYQLYYDNKIGLYEKNFMIDYINDRQPDVTWERGFWWKVGVKKPRIDWINEQLKELKNEQDDE